ncbi:MAG: hypothetical protein JWP89_6543 [Schlesneria sp.]|nr:hypothetical protein [Schlesneria sp.]
MGILIVVRTRLAASNGRRPVGTFVMTTGLAMLCFIPSCAGIGFLVDTQRFGLAHYPTHQAIWNFHSPESIPNSATEITIDKFASGYRARFKISKIDLESWLDEIWKKYGDFSVIQRELRDNRPVINATDFPEEFLVYEWRPAAETIKYGGPFSSRGSGFEIWYSPSEEVAYQSCSYW